MPAEHYQNVIIGSGEGGKYLAWHLAESATKYGSLSADGLAARARILIAFLQRTRSGAKVAPALCCSREFGVFSWTRVNRYGTV